MLEIRPLEGFDAYEAGDIPSVLYSPRIRNVFAAINGPLSGSDISFMIINDGKPLAYFLAYIDYSHEVISLSAPRLPAVFWFTSHFSPQVYFEVKTQSINYFKKCIADYSTINIKFIDFFSYNTLSPIAQYLMQSYKCKTNLVFNHVIDISICQDALKRNLRSRYKQFINKADREFTFVVYDKNNIRQEHIDQLHECHILASGRDVYPEQMFWTAWLKECKAGYGFLVIAYQDMRPVGASLCTIADKTAYYSIGAYDRKITHSGLSHGCIWHAIIYAKNNNLDFFEIGHTYFECVSKGITDKEMSIGFFKRGFGGYNHPCLYVECLEKNL